MTLHILQNSISCFLPFSLWTQLSMLVWHHRAERRHLEPPLTDKYEGLGLKTLAHWTDVHYYWAKEYMICSLWQMLSSQYCWDKIITTIITALMDGWVNRIPWLAYDEKPDLLLWWPSCINFERINLTYFPRTHIPFMYYPLLQCIVLNWLTDSLLTRRLDCWPWQCVQHLAIYIC